jgi:hypothetical protein
MAALLAAVPARAQPVDLPQSGPAQALYDIAVKEMKTGSYEAACPMFEEVVRLAPEALGAKRALAVCYEGLGKLASAWTLYKLIASAATDPKWVDETRRKADELQPKLARLTINVPEEIRALPGVEVQRNGIRMGEPQWGVPIPVDKGAHVLTVTAKGKRTWERTVTVEADGASVDVVVGPLEGEASPGVTILVPAGVRALPGLQVRCDGIPVPAAQWGSSIALSTGDHVLVAIANGKRRWERTVRVEGEAAPITVTIGPLQDASVAPQPQPDLTPAPEPANGRRIAGFVVGGLGLAGLAVGGVAGGLALGKKQVVDENCPDLQCQNEEGWAAVDDANAFATVSTVGFAVGLAGLATGAVLVLTAPDKKNEASVRAELRAGAFRDGIAVGVKGAF